MTKPPNSGGLVFLAVVLGLNLLLLLLLRIAPASTALRDASAG